jgi:hypothetical protein
LGWCMGHSAITYHKEVGKGLCHYENLYRYQKTWYKISVQVIVDISITLQAWRLLWVINLNYMGPNLNQPLWYWEASALEKIGLQLWLNEGTDTFETMRTVDNCNSIWPIWGNFSYTWF